MRRKKAEAKSEKWARGGGNDRDDSRQGEDSRGGVKGRSDGEREDRQQPGNHIDPFSCPAYFISGITRSNSFIYSIYYLL